MTHNARVKKILDDAKKLAKEYQDYTKKPLGISGEIAEFEAGYRLGVTLATARQSGYDAIEHCGDKPDRFIQIKGRRLLPDGRPSQRTGSIDISKKNWDSVMLVLLDENFDATQIYEADRDKVEAQLDVSKGKPRRDLDVNKFKSIARLRWPLPSSEK